MQTIRSRVVVLVFVLMTGCRSTPQVLDVPSETADLRSLCAALKNPALDALEANDLKLALRASEFVIRVDNDHWDVDAEREKARKSFEAHRPITRLARVLDGFPVDQLKDASVRAVVLKYRDETQRLRESASAVKGEHAMDTFDRIVLEIDRVTRAAARDLSTRSAKRGIVCETLAAAIP
jgi:hypothetical protein